MPAAEKVALIDSPWSQRHCHWFNYSATSSRREPCSPGAKFSLLVGIGRMKLRAGSARRAPPRARNRTWHVKTLKNLENFTVFDRVDHIWLVLIDQERSRTIKKSQEKDETIKDDQRRSKNKVVNFRGNI